jgi:hypothetical protein
MKVEDGDVAAIRKDSIGGLYVSYIEGFSIGDELPADYLRKFSTRGEADFTLRRLLASKANDAADLRRKENDGHEEKRG